MSSSLHFLNTGSSDCIIIESNGHYAMVDCAEDTDYPEDKPHLKYPGYEDVVLEYLMKNCRDADGFVTLDFVLATHAHSDHIGGFDTIIADENVRVKTAYLKPYIEKDIFIYERKAWDNLEVYTQMKKALEDKGVPIVQSFDRKEVTLGDFKIKFFNGDVKKHFFKYGENVNSVATLVTKDNYRILLAGDMNNKALDEYKIKNEIGKVDVLKVGHHGYPYSTSLGFLKTLMPTYAVICNTYKKVYPHIKYKLKNISKSKIYCTVESNGVKFSFDDGIKTVEGIM